MPLIHHKRDSYHHLALFTGGRINILKRHVATDDNSNKKLSLKAFYVKFSLLPQTAFKAVSLNRHIIKLSRFSTFSTAPQTNHIFAENVALVYSFNYVLEYLPTIYLPPTYNIPCKSGTSDGFILVYEHWLYNFWKRSRF